MYTYVYLIPEEVSSGSKTVTVSVRESFTVTFFFKKKTSDLD